MKKMIWTFLVSALVLMYSCSSSVEANKMADEMCAVLEKYKDDDLMSMVDAASDVNNILIKKDEYGEVTEAQLKRAMLKKCPTGWKKYSSLKGK